MNKKWIWALTLVVFFSVSFWMAGAFELPRGGWLDRGISFAASKLAGVPVRFYDVRISRTLDTVRFGMLSVTDPRDNKILFVSGPGEVRRVSGTLSIRGVQRLEARLEDAVIMEDLCRRSPLITWASQQAFDRPIFLKRVRLVAQKHAERTTFHLLSCESDQLVLNGGVLLRGRQVIKVHALVLLPAEKFEKMPKEMRARMIQRRAGWRGLRLVYSGDFFTAIGESGPFFQARWNRGQA